ncbi:uncharacterized protein BX663DRAFT_497587 [Cokeromyces recurvatus]|uniref:uncharacterized protein n=1 Tax=Cokeromyces recurvatus TaxID=90255 RepID=UPI00221F5D77|nr:uncharacterized protein BX663DRAFT_497587 [Cokeromyces recurvatus]KAI7906790.1 hypothetical protein BX663DRAFT_497587 [Cokeromyces recurvatus]
MTNGNKFEQLPFELILKISENLRYPDIWYLGACSRKSRLLSHQVLQSKYQIDLLIEHGKSVCSTFDHLIHAAVAYLERHGIIKQDCNRFLIDPFVLQSVANHMAIAINDRVIQAQDKNDSLSYLLDKTLRIIVDHHLLDPDLGDYSIDNTNKSTSVERKLFLNDREWKLLHLQPEESSLTCVLLADYLAVLHETLSIIFYDACFSSTHCRLLIMQLQRQLTSIRLSYQDYHIERLLPIVELPGIMIDDKIMNAALKEKSREFILLIQFLCALIQADLLSSSDVDQFVNSHVHRFFITQPCDLRYTVDSSVPDGILTILLRIYNNHHHNHHNQELTIKHDINTKYSFSYLWKLWLNEIQLRLQVLLDILRFLIIKNIANSNRRHGVEHITGLLEETIHALSITSTIYKTASSTTLTNST